MNLRPNLVAGLRAKRSLHEQIIEQANYVQCGWETVAEELANNAVEWFGNEPCKTAKEFRSVCNEVFREV